LLRRGIDVSVHEQAPHLGEVGAGIGIMPNGMKLLERYGLGDAIRDVSVQFQSGSSYYHFDGSYVSEYVISDSSGEGGIFGIHRADYVSVLAAGLPEGVVHTGQRATRFEQSETGALVGFDGGEEVEADIVVGADGIHSTMRAHVVEPAAPIHSGTVGYRGLVPASRLPDWSRGVWEMWMGDSRHFLVFPVRRGELLTYVGYVPSTVATSESWSAPGDPNLLRSEFEGWDPRVTACLDQVESTFWWGLHDREPISHWSNGRLTLLGDAAHPMLPHLGQGANQSLEDGAALALLLSKAGTGNELAALDAYATLRKDRVATVQSGSRTNGALYDSGSEDSVGQRDAALAAAAAFRWNLYDYDAEAAAERLLIDS
jgi:salicylate hydroxylase